MKLQEFLSNHSCQNDMYTFVIAKAVKDEHAPGYHYEYESCPYRTIWKWRKFEKLMNYILINPNHPPIDVPGHYTQQFINGYVKCCVITTEEDIRTLYSENQANEMLAWYDKKVREYVEKVVL